MQIDYSTAIGVLSVGYGFRGVNKKELYTRMYEMSELLFSTIEDTIKDRRYFKINEDDIVVLTKEGRKALEYVNTVLLDNVKE